MVKLLQIIGGENKRRKITQEGDSEVETAWHLSSQCIKPAIKPSQNARCITKPSICNKGAESLSSVPAQTKTRIFCYSAHCFGRRAEITLTLKETTQSAGKVMICRKKGKPALRVKQNLSDVT